MKRSFVAKLEFEFTGHLTIEIARFYCFLFLPSFFSLCESDADFYEISFAVYLHRDDRCSHFFYFCLESVDLIFFHEDISFSFGFYESTPSFVLSDVDPGSARVSFMYEDIGSLEIDASISDTFYFFTEELDTCLILFDDLIVEEGFFIICEDDFLTCRKGHVEIIDKSDKKQLAFHIKYDKI